MLTAETTEPGIDPMLDLMDIWLPKDNLIVTVPVGKDTKPVRIVEWKDLKTDRFTR